jgi:hypothetical protein
MVPPSPTASSVRPGVGAAGREPLPDRAVRSWYVRWALHLFLPLVLSLVIHLCVVTFLALKTLRIVGRAADGIGQWTGTIVDADQTGAALQWESDNQWETPSDTPLDTSLDNLSSLAETESLAGGDVDVSAPDVSPGCGDAAGGLGEGALTLLGTGSGAAEAGQGGFGSGLGSGGARIGHVGVWDLAVPANNVVFVVDFSGSILAAVDDLKRELKHSISRLTPNQSFDVIVFYSAGGGTEERVRTESFRPQLERADRETRRAFFKWLDQKAPMGVTEPLDAVKRALALKPDAIFFFSDGYFDDTVVTEIQRANRAVGTRIFCLVFDELLLGDDSGLPRDTEGARRLRRIAEDNRGQVKIVTGKDLAR